MISHMITFHYIVLIFFFRALTKDTEIGISAQHIEDDAVEELLVQGGAVSPIVTIEPRRRKFHKAITITIPLPERMPQSYGGGRGAAGSVGSSRKTSMESLNRNVAGKGKQIQYLEMADKLNPLSSNR